MQRWGFGAGFLGVLATHMHFACAPLPDLVLELPDGGAEDATNSGDSAGNDASLDRLVETGAVDGGADEEDAGNGVLENPCPSPRFSCCGELFCWGGCTHETCRLCEGLDCKPDTEFCCYAGGNSVSCVPFGESCGGD